MYPNPIAAFLITVLMSLLALAYTLYKAKNERRSRLRRRANHA
jgi:hypothetical protein